MATMTSVFAPICKTEKLPDGTLLVYGKITGPDLDLDEQRCDPDWLRTAVPDWATIGNVREMHQAWAVGKALDVEADGDDWYTTAKIVDAGAIQKIDEGVYTGFSIGIKGPKIVKDASAPNGRINGGKIIETSLVDRPCNETAKLLLVKMAGDVLVDATTEPDPDPPVETQEDAVKFTVADLVKAFTDEAPDEDRSAVDDLCKALVARMPVDELRKALGIDELEEKTTALSEAKTVSPDELAKVEQRLDASDERLVKVEEMAAPGGPVRMPPVNDEAAKAVRMAEAARLNQLSHTVTDRELAAVYAHRAAALVAGADSTI